MPSCIHPMAMNSIQPEYIDINTLNKHSVYKDEFQFPNQKRDTSAAFHTLHLHHSQHGQVITPVIKCRMKLFNKFLNLNGVATEVWESTSNHTAYWACDYVSIMGFKLIHVNKRRIIQ